MSSEWRECSLGNLITIKHGFAFSGGHISKNQGKCVLVTPGNFDIGGGFKEGNAKYFHGEYPEEYVFAPGDLIVTMTDLSKTADTLGYSAKIPGEQGKTFLHNQRIGKVCSKSPEAELDYLFWVMRHRDYRSWIVNTATGSTVKHTSPSRILEYSFQLPPISEQKAIAHILGTLDDKIELNRKTNETLEAMAKALFKSWFVDFDPVRAKAEGRPTGLPSEISDLFPDSFEDSELGEIPSGWRISNLADFIHLDSGLPYKGLQKGTGDAHLLTMGCADRALRFKSDGVHSYPSPIPARHLVNPGDIVICSHDLTQAREQLGAPFVVPDNFSGRIVAAATNTFIVRQKSPSTTEYLYQIFRSNGFREQMIASAKGSVILHISKESVLYYSFASPGSDRLISAYQSATDGMTQKIQEIGKCIYTLTTIRDALLPKLISGGIRIPDAEKMLEEVGA
jgi:type I restriction enzyme S subunit